MMLKDAVMLFISVLAQWDLRLLEKLEAIAQVHAKSADIIAQVTAGSE